MIEYKNMNYDINKKTILIIGFPWPYSYGGHRTTKLCRELSKQYNVNIIVKTVDYLISIPSRSTARIQEAHILVLHIICSLVEERF